jgi:hypothetical protein
LSPPDIFDLLPDDHMPRSAQVAAGQMLREVKQKKGYLIKYNL